MSPALFNVQGYLSLHIPMILSDIWAVTGHCKVTEYELDGRGLIPGMCVESFLFTVTSTAVLDPTPPCPGLQRSDCEGKY
jgi:hypothetical protein